MQYNSQYHYEGVFVLFCFSKQQKVFKIMHSDAVTNIISTKRKTGHA